MASRRSRAAIDAARSEAIARLQNSIRRGELVVVFGTGVSIALTDGTVPAMSWRGLIGDGFAYGVKKGKVSSEQARRWKRQLASNDLDELLGAAEFMGRKLDAPRGDLYARWLRGAFEAVQPTNHQLADSIRALSRANLPLCTLNYDSLLEGVTGRPSITVSETARATAWARKEDSGVLHLHGHWAAPESCVLGIRDYESTQHDEVRELLQRHLGAFRRLLFIGCGDTFRDPNFSALVRWLREHMKAAAPGHYALVTDEDLASRERDEAWRGFVDPIGYGSHASLAMFIDEHFASVRIEETVYGHGEVSATSRRSAHAKLLNEYREFLLRDCGQMTIEGMRAELDTAQRKFDLERLFVPLKITRAQRLKPRKKANHAWRFSAVFRHVRRITLLALPGGGKSLLLKRLAVAYADPSRRSASVDGLPDLDVFPVMIRCREWREHIHCPIATLLRDIPHITGQPRLSGLVDALEPLFRQGRILLLVDGLDEIHDDGLRTTFVDHLEKFLEEHPRTRLVVTSREAGFELIAPNFIRFSWSFRISPLEDGAIRDLCHHWHRLMIGESPSAQAEADQVWQQLSTSDSLRRLAENPLLLTMLLVVKHGAGRLPLDRVGLYARAVEVLLDTWNIKGHLPLNPREAVPQLACIAFEMMRAGKQTATKRELLSLLDEARDRIAHIRRYAKDTPDEFLRRVELRSSLVVEAGHQLEHGRTVPIYQFRHLTFQEYLAAVAAAEGYFMEYQKGASVLTPLEPYLTAPEWAEVIPMAAVIARKSAEPLLAALVTRANLLREQLEVSGSPDGNEAWLKDRLPAPIARLVQCLAEEAEPSGETLAIALRSILLFARVCASSEAWVRLAKGPYGDELVHHAIERYRRMDWPQEAQLMQTCGSLLVLRRPEGHWETPGGRNELEALLDDKAPLNIATGLLTLGGVLSADRSDYGRGSTRREYRAVVEGHLFDDRMDVRLPALSAWVTSLEREFTGAPLLNDEQRLLDRVTRMWLHEPRARDDAARALFAWVSRPRGSWTPSLTDEECALARALATDHSDPYDVSRAMSYVVSLILAFHTGRVWQDDELQERLHKNGLSVILGARTQTF